MCCCVFRRLCASLAHRAATTRHHGVHVTSTVITHWISARFHCWVPVAHCVASRARRRFAGGGSVGEAAQARLGGGRPLCAAGARAAAPDAVLRAGRRRGEGGGGGRRRPDAPAAPLKQGMEAAEWELMRTHADRKVVQSTLANGMRLMVQHNGSPSHQICVRLASRWPWGWPRYVM